MQKKSPRPRDVARPLRVSSIGEFGLIRRIKKNAQKQLERVCVPCDPAILLGIGDDAAAVLPSPGNCLLVTTDILLEKTHFDLALSSFFQIGYKSIAVNLSDIAAMGGVPRFYLVSLGLTGKESVSDMDHLYQGMFWAGHEAGISLIGGNTARSAFLLISITLLGEIPKNEMVMRSGANVGDCLYVTGTLGDSAAGLEILQKRMRKGTFRGLPSKHQMPMARWREGRLLAQNQIPSAMIDLSDGLSSDLSHLAIQSGVGARLECKNIPISPTLKRYAKSIGANPYDYALHGGEEYELLFCVPEEKRDKLEALIQNGEIEARQIGKLIPKRNGILVKGIDGAIYKLRPSGYDHFNEKR
ncbi:MAG: thiamine-phosphate kinase [Nitrospirae bacterium]|nr:thiamine-phosphate kinase [Candidatus Troglogloeales bacterium]